LRRESHHVGSSKMCGPFGPCATLTAASSRTDCAPHALPPRPLSTGGTRLRREITLASARSAGLDLFTRPFRRPVDTTLPNPIMGLAGKAPVPDRWRQRHALSVIGELPPRRSDRQPDLVPTAAATEVYRRAKRKRDVKHALLKDIRSLSHE
jgi:hypothetical protein